MLEPDLSKAYAVVEKILGTSRLITQLLAGAAGALIIIGIFLFI